MERRSILVDVSHLSDAAFDDVARQVRRPFIARHSNARAVCPVRRNLTDDQVRILAERGGVIGVHFGAGFVDPRRGRAGAPHIAAWRALAERDPEAAMASLQSGRGPRSPFRPLPPIAARVAGARIHPATADRGRLVGGGRMPTSPKGPACAIAPPLPAPCGRERLQPRACALGRAQSCGGE